MEYGVPALYMIRMCGFGKKGNLGSGAVSD